MLRSKVPWADWLVSPRPLGAMIPAWKNNGPAKEAYRHNILFDSRETEKVCVCDALHLLRLWYIIWKRQRQKGKCRCHRNLDAQPSSWMWPADAVRHSFPSRSTEWYPFCPFKKQRLRPHLAGVLPSIWDTSIHLFIFLLRHLFPPFFIFFLIKPSSFSFFFFFFFPLILLHALWRSGH